MTTLLPGEVEAVTEFPLWRTPVFAVIAVILIGAGLLAAGIAKPAPVAPPPMALSAVASPATAESSSWYCAGGTGTPGSAAVATLYLSNTTSHPISGTVTVLSTTDPPSSVSVTVPAGTEATFVPSSIHQSTWLASDVAMHGGGVVVSELISGPLGWAEAPCASVASPRWYFASGSTVNGSTLYVAIMNPLPTTAVVDLQFTTASGLVSPQPFQGLVLAAHTMAVAEVASYVQNVASVSTNVVAQSGSVVAAELQEQTVGPQFGLSLRLGAPAPSPNWTLPRSVDVTGGRTSIDVFNPGSTAENVQVHIHLPSGPIAPFIEKIGPDSTWTLVTSTSSRVPPNIDFAASVVATGGSGVVVDRISSSSPAGGLPEWGEVSAVPDVASDVHARAWIIPGPSRPIPSPEPDAAPFALALSNPGRSTVVVRVSRYSNGALVALPHVASIHIDPGKFAVIEPSRVSTTGSTPLVVTSSGPLATMEDDTPAGMPGVVSMAGIPTGR